MDRSRSKNCRNWSYSGVASMGPARVSNVFEQDPGPPMMTTGTMKQISCGQTPGLKTDHHFRGLQAGLVHMQLERQSSHRSCNEELYDDTSGPHDTSALAEGDEGGYESTVVVHTRRENLTGRRRVEIRYGAVTSVFNQTLREASRKLVIIGLNFDLLTASKLTRMQGISKSTMKIVCRRLGIEKWPYKHTSRRNGQSNTSKWNSAAQRRGKSESRPASSRTRITVVAQAACAARRIGS
eukprot:757699-Hanusia_phi.AAC.6